MVVVGAAVVVVVVVVVGGVAPAALRHNPVQGGAAAPPEAWALKLHCSIQSSSQRQPFGYTPLGSTETIAYPLAAIARPHSSLVAINVSSSHFA